MTSAALEQLTSVHESALYALPFLDRDFILDSLLLDGCLLSLRGYLHRLGLLHGSHRLLGLLHIGVIV
jgi:hypothetical protein